MYFRKKIDMKQYSDCIIQKGNKGHCVSSDVMILIICSSVLAGAVYLQFRKTNQPTRWSCWIIPHTVIRILYWCRCDLDTVLCVSVCLPVFFCPCGFYCPQLSWVFLIVSLIPFPVYLKSHLPSVPVTSCHTLSCPLSVLPESDCDH